MTPCGWKISTKSLYLARLRRLEANLCFFDFWRKFKIAVIFGERKFFFKIAYSTFLKYPVGRKFRRNHSISHGLGDRHIYVFCSVAITQEVKAITINNNTKQAIDAINLHTKF